jgi:copper chaperone
MSETKLTISGMSCEHCVSNATQALEGVPGVEKAEVTLKPGAAVVYGNAKVEELIAAVAEKGYEAKQA